jgi:hypothetical protein
MGQPARKATASLELQVEPQAPAGTLTADDGFRRAFTGWIELATAIEDWRALHRGAGVPEDADPDHRAAGSR